VVTNLNPSYRVKRSIRSIHRDNYWQVRCRGRRQNEGSGIIAAGKYQYIAAGANVSPKPENNETASIVARQRSHAKWRCLRICARNRGSDWPPADGRGRSNRDTGKLTSHSMS
jgi:hypothetical protein